MVPEYSFTQESDDNHESWPMYPTEPLQIQVFDSAPLHTQLSLPIIYPEQWNNYPNCVLPNEATQSSPSLMMTSNYSPSGSNSLSPYTMQTPSSLPPSSLPQLSPTNSDPSLSPLYSSSRLGTPTTPPSLQSFIPSPTFLPSPALMPSPTLSQGDHMPQQDSQVSNSDVCHIYLFIYFYWARIHRRIDLVSLIDNNFNYSAKL